MKKDRMIVVITVLFFLGLSLANIGIKTPDYSESERRVLAKFPEAGVEEILSGEFAAEFDEYATERFVGRDTWRRIKAYAKTGLFLQKDNNGIYTAGRNISKMDGPMRVEMAEYSVRLFEKVIDKYQVDNDVYFAVIPDKNWYLAEKSGHLALDYNAFSQYMKEQLPMMNPIEVAHLLDADDYYYTDTHWRQEKIVDVAKHIAEEMGTTLSEEYQNNKATERFNGVYVGQSALICEPDTIIYLENDVTKQLEVEGADAVYDIKKAEERDPYEMFLSGNQPIVKIKNPLASDEKRLILFRDSFGSSIAPLLAEGYSEVVLVDLRYISSDMLGEYVDFEDADVLFLYSTLLLNNSLAMK